MHQLLETGILVSGFDEPYLRKEVLSEERGEISQEKVTVEGELALQVPVAQVDRFEEKLLE